MTKFPNSSSLGSLLRLDLDCVLTAVYTLRDLAYFPHVTSNELIFLQYKKLVTKATGKNLIQEGLSGKNCPNPMSNDAFRFNGKNMFSMAKPKIINDPIFWGHG